MGDNDYFAAVAIQKVWRGNIGRTDSARIQLARERDKMKAKQHKKHNLLNVQNQRSLVQHEIASEPIVIFKAVKKPKNIVCSPVYKPSQQQLSPLRDQENDILRDSLADSLTIPSKTTHPKHNVHPVSAGNSPIFNAERPPLPGRVTKSVTTGDAPVDDETLLEDSLILKKVVNKDRLDVNRVTSSNTSLVKPVPRDRYAVSDDENSIYGQFIHTEPDTECSSFNDNDDVQSEGDGLANEDMDDDSVDVVVQHQKSKNVVRREEDNKRITETSEEENVEYTDISHLGFDEEGECDEEEDDGYRTNVNKYYYNHQPSQSVVEQHPHHKTDGNLQTASSNVVTKANKSMGSKPVPVGSLRQPDVHDGSMFSQKQRSEKVSSASAEIPSRLPVRIASHKGSSDLSSYDLKQNTVVVGTDSLINKNYNLQGNNVRNTSQVTAAVPSVRDLLQLSPSAGSSEGRRGTSDQQPQRGENNSVASDVLKMYEQSVKRIMPADSNSSVKTNMSNKFSGGSRVGTINNIKLSKQQLRQQRDIAVTVIQKSIRGYLGRKIMHKRRLASLDRYKCQTCGRIDKSAHGQFCIACGRPRPHLQYDQSSSSHHQQQLHQPSHVQPIRGDGIGRAQQLRDRIHASGSDCEQPYPIATTHNSSNEKYSQNQQQQPPRQQMNNYHQVESPPPRQHHQQQQQQQQEDYDQGQQMSFQQSKHDVNQTAHNIRQQQELVSQQQQLQYPPPRVGGGGGGGGYSAKFRQQSPRSRPQAQQQSVPPQAHSSHQANAYKPEAKQKVKPTPPSKDTRISIDGTAEARLLAELDQLNEVQRVKMRELGKIEQQLQQIATKPSVGVAKPRPVGDNRREKEKTPAPQGVVAAVREQVVAPVVVAPPAVAKEKVAFKWGAKDYREKPVVPSAVSDKHAANKRQKDNVVSPVVVVTPAVHHHNHDWQQPSAPVAPLMNNLMGGVIGGNAQGALNQQLQSAAGGGYLQEYRKKIPKQQSQGNGQRRNHDNDDNISSYSSQYDARSEGRNPKQSSVVSQQQQSYAESSSLPALVSARRVVDSNNGGGGVPSSQQQGGYVHPLDQPNRRVSSRGSTMSAPPRLDEGSGVHFPAPVRVSHDYGPQQAVPMSNAIRINNKKGR